MPTSFLIHPDFQCQKKGNPSSSLPLRSCPFRHQAGGLFFFHPEGWPSTLVPLNFGPRVRGNPSKVHLHFPCFQHQEEGTLVNLTTGVGHLGIYYICNV